MSDPDRNNWRTVQEEVRRRIVARVWQPGDLIPNEADLAKEFGCARTTVNRALQELAASGLLDRRRRAGTRVAPSPVRKTRLEIPLLRTEIEAKGAACNHVILLREMRIPLPSVQGRMSTAANETLLHLQALYTADGEPYAFEDRWIDPKSVPSVAEEDFSTLSPNEWLVREVPADEGEIVFSAITCSQDLAARLACREGEALFVLDRTTMHAGRMVTSVRLVFHRGYRLQTRL